jgi:hypothetical protein
MLKFLVDWDKNENFTGIYDDITSDVVSAEWFLGARSPFQSVCDELTLRMVVKNTDGKYSPENTGSVIAGKLQPYCRVRVVESVSSAELWNGYLDFPSIQWRPAAVVSGKETVILEAVGAKQLLERITVTLPQYTNETGDAVLLDVLEQAGIFLTVLDAWKIGIVGASEIGETTILTSDGIWRVVDEGQTFFDTYGGGRENAWAIIQDVSETERGKFYIDRNGRYVWRNRHHAYLSDTTDATTTESGKTGIDYKYGDLFVNSVTVTGKPKVTQASELLWSLQAPVTISPGQTVVIEARLRRSTGQFATATTLTPSSTFSQGSATITVTPNGGVANIEIENTGTSTAILSTLTLSGSPSYDQNQLIVNIENASSISLYGKRETSFTVNNISEYRVISDIAHMELARLPIRGRAISFTMTKESDGIDNAAIVTGFEIGDFVEIDFDDTLYHSGRYIIIGESHVYTSPNLHTATFFLEPVTQAGFVLDVVGRMELDGEKTVIIY